MIMFAVRPICPQEAIFKMSSMRSANDSTSIRYGVFFVGSTFAIRYCVKSHSMLVSNYVLFMIDGGFEISLCLKALYPLIVEVWGVFCVFQSD